MGDLPGSLGYRVQAPEVIIDAMWFIWLVSIPLLHPSEHLSMKLLLSGLFKNHEKLVSYDYLSWKWS